MNWIMRARSTGVVALVVSMLGVFFVGLLEFFRIFDAPRGAGWASSLTALLLGCVATLVCCVLLSFVFDLACRLMGATGARRRQR